jgi:K+-transporting ATPase ATPase C chain
MLQNLRPAIVMVALFTLFFGLAYPLAMTGISGLAFPAQAAGSLTHDAKGQVTGSILIAQAFAKPQYLHPRPSAAGMGYDPMNSSGSNYGPMDPKLSDRVKGDAAAYRKDNGVTGEIPADAVTTSGSGLDPEISPANAALQAPRIAAARGLPADMVTKVINDETRLPALGFIGQPGVNVLAVNRALDGLQGKAHMLEILQRAGHPPRREGHGAGDGAGQGPAQRRSAGHLQKASSAARS